MLKFLLTLGIIIVAVFNSSAQFGSCVDTTLIIPYSYCYPIYEPVCGCDGKTYRNTCNATQLNGVVQYEDGICEPVDFDATPNPVQQYLYVDIITKNQGNVLLTIMDLYGNKKYEQYYRDIERRKITLDVSQYEYGLYFIMVESQGYYVVKRFAKTDL